jgi:tRNA-2-methylthio-N6-dimethylallyladenosine synthase
LTNNHVTTEEMLEQQFQLQRLRAEGSLRQYHISTFGCQQNENDSEKIAGILQQAGMTEAADYRDADLVIMNTCSVRENADDRLFGHLGVMKNLKRKRPGVLIGLCGCMMTQDIHTNKIRKSYPFVDLLFGPQEIHLLPGLLCERVFEGQKAYAGNGADLIAEDLPVVRARKFRALVSIMYGCNNFCSYCIVPYTRGRERSREPERILAEIRQLAAAGYREVLLLGQNVNSYAGMAAGETAAWDFPRLLEAVAAIPGLYRVRFMTSHPKDLSASLIDVIAANPNIERHLHLPLQSGSSRILKQMNRHYDREQYLAIVKLARERIPDLAISTDIIVGFPGETEEDFAETLSLMAEVKFDSAFTFQYSKRPGTPAAKRPDQISAEVVKERFGRLTELQNANSLAANEAQVGKLVEVLIEGPSHTDSAILTGRGSDFRLINFMLKPEAVAPESQAPSDSGIADPAATAAALEGRLALVRITNAKTFSLEGELECLLA